MESPEKPKDQFRGSGLGFIKNIFTNSLFHIGGYFNKPQRTAINIFGNDFDNKEGVQAFEKIIWFTYRKDFPGLIGSDVSSDTGWGCMVRVGQMLLAQVLKRHANIENIQDLTSIITSFLDDDQNKKNCFNYSIQKIANTSQKQFNLQPGQWLTVSNISFIMQKIHHKHPLRGYQNLRIQVFNNGAMFYQDVLKALDYQLCVCNQINIFCQKCHKNNNKSLMMIIIARIGNQKPDNQFKPMLFDMMRMKYFSGMLGGKPNKALYFVGLQQEQLIYLDPHFVQNSTNRKNIGDQMQTHFCKSFRTISYNDIDPSVGITMYLDNIQQLGKFSEQMKVIQQRYKNQFFLYINRKSFNDQGPGIREMTKTQSFQYSATFQI